jgi:hypothetical protein
MSPWTLEKRLAECPKVKPEIAKKRVLKFEHKKIMSNKKAIWSKPLKICLKPKDRKLKKDKLSSALWSLSKIEIFRLSEEIIKSGKSWFSFFWEEKSKWERFKSKNKLKLNLGFSVEQTNLLRYLT